MSDDEKIVLPESKLLDCVVLSGGGAKGAYGAGAAKGILAYRKAKNIERAICYIGASAGALNAAVLAAKNDADSLIRFWRGVNNQNVLGVRVKNVKFQAAVEWTKTQITGNPFSFYPNSALGKLITNSVKFNDLKNSHLLIAATDYGKGALKAYYVSTLGERFKKEDDKLPEHRKRLQHWREIKDQGGIEKALLASAAIPMFFPPVLLDGTLHVDGGVGNHTPTREAAYFFRSLRKHKLGDVGNIFCISQDPPRILDEGKGSLGLFDILKRTLEIYHHIHTAPIINAWDRINHEVEEHDKRFSKFTAWLEKQPCDQALKNGILAQLDEVGLSHHGAKDDMFKTPLIKIEPSSPLGDSLDFAPRLIKENIIRGYLDALLVLRSAGMIDAAEFNRLKEQEII